MRTFDCRLFVLIPTQPLVSQVTVEVRDTRTHERETDIVRDKKRKEKERETQDPLNKSFSFKKKTNCSTTLLLQQSESEKST